MTYFIATNDALAHDVYKEIQRVADNWGDAWVSPQGINVRDEKGIFAKVDNIFFWKIAEYPKNGTFDKGIVSCSVWLESFYEQNPELRPEPPHMVVVEDESGELTVQVVSTKSICEQYIESTTRNGKNVYYLYSLVKTVR